MKLPYGNAVDRHQIQRKLETYALNSMHSSGQHKARLFRSKLGITLENKQVLIAALASAAQQKEAFFTTSDQHGDRYVVDFHMQTQAGASTVRSAWIIRQGESYPRLTSVYPI
ncbi:DUF6883 domain-containing protein [Leptolyngbya subtilissima]|nr:hypothetical protein [Nodosilinea sp. FACHB-141]